MVFNKLSMTLAAALFLSLSVNFFLAGLMLGNAVSTPKPAAAEETQARMSPEEARRAEWQKRDEALRAALSPADRDIVQSHTEANKQIFEELKTKLDEARQSVAAAMTAEPFDQQALDAAIEAETEAKAMFMREMYRARRAVMEELSPEGRKTFQEMNPLRRRGGHRPPPSEAEAGMPEERRAPRLRDRKGPEGEEGAMRERMMERRERIEQMRQMRQAPSPPGSARPEEKAPPPATGPGGTERPSIPAVPPPAAP